jgi:8-amino-7-oxononanoate synthase
MTMASASVPVSDSATSSLEIALHAEQEALRAQGLYRTRHALEGKQAATVAVHGREFVSFASNDYLGLAADPRIVAAVCEGAERFGVGAGASHLLYGHHQAHDAAESALAQFVGYPRALLFSSGYTANLGVVSALCGRGDAIFCDRLNHASLNDGMLLARARFHRYPHHDLERLQHALQTSRARRKLVLSDAVFSMDGDIAPVPQLLSLCERYDAWLLLDDAHGFGVLGEHGAGTLSHYGVKSERIIYMGTLGKAAGIGGAFVAASRVLIEQLVNRARTYIYTTAPPPLLSHALMTSLDIVRAEDWRRARLAQWIRLFASARGGLLGTLTASSTPIQPLVLGDSQTAVAASQRLADAGLLVPAVRPPTVPRGTARLRISLSAAHTIEQVERLLAMLRTLADERRSGLG